MAHAHPTHPAPTPNRTPPAATPAAPLWVRGLTAGGRPIVLGVALLMCAPGEYHLARAAGWATRWAYGMPVVLSAYAGIAAAVASTRRRGDRGRWSAILGAIIALSLAMAAQIVSHLVTTGMASARHPWLIGVVSLVPPAVVGHVLHLAATPPGHAAPAPVRPPAVPAPVVPPSTRPLPTTPHRRPVPVPLCVREPAPQLQAFVWQPRTGTAAPRQPTGTGTAAPTSTAPDRQPADTAPAPAPAPGTGAATATGGGGGGGGGRGRAFATHVQTAAHWLQDDPGLSGTAIGTRLGTGASYGRRVRRAALKTANPCWSIPPGDCPPICSVRSPGERTPPTPSTG